MSFPLEKLIIFQKKENPNVQVYMLVRKGGIIVRVKNHDNFKHPSYIGTVYDEAKLREYAKVDGWYMVEGDMKEIEDLFKGHSKIITEVEDIDLEEKDYLILVRKGVIQEIGSLGEEE